MRYLSTNLQGSVTGTYDKTKTTVAGLVTQKVINTKNVVSPPLTKFIDVFTDSAGTVTPSGVMYASPTGRLWILGTVASAATPVAYYNFNYTTGVYSYGGRVNISFPNSAATTHTVRFLRVNDTNASNIKVYVS